jgi:hypothetical protein
LKNHYPIKRAKRNEWRRKRLGADRCFFCLESDLACLELEHPVGRKLDSKFERAVCRNCHRKFERERDIARLTKNGLHKRREPKYEKLRIYLLLLALDQEGIADVMESPAASQEMIVAALRSTAASLRRRATQI